MIKSSPWIVALTLTPLFTLTSCSTQIPNTTSVETGLAMDKSDDAPSFQYYPVGPTQNASPEEIIKGFLDANTGFQDNFAVAKQYLSTASVQSWNPSQEVKVYRGELKQQKKTLDQRIKVNFDMIKHVDEHGILDNDFYPNQGINFQVVQENGQWRIKNPPNILLLNEQSFNTLFQSYRLYFESGYQKMLTPDVRWFPQRSSTASLIVRELIAGPQPWLRTAVSNPLENQLLSKEGVVEKSDGIEINLEAQSQELTQTELTSITDQLKGSLAQTVSVPTNVSLIQGGTERENFTVDPQNDSPTQNVTEVQIGVQNNSLKILKDGQLENLNGFHDVSTMSPSKPAISYDEKTVAFFSGGNVALMSEGQEPRLISSGEYATMSFDPTSRLWVVEKSNTGEIMTFNSSGSLHEVESSWLKGKSLVDFKVSRDGTRAVVITQENDVYKIYSSAISKDSDGNPSALVGSEEIGEGVTGDHLAWISGDSIAVIKSNTPEATPYIMQLGGAITKLPPVSSISGLSAGNNENQVYLYNDQGKMYHLAGQSWTASNIVLQDPNFPG
ncbi:MAG: LpqB family beta-propeller domain-containing protein [Micrococcaceae bacterium]